MDVQAAPPTYTPAGGVRPPAGNPPVLGQQVPGMSGGLPAQGGLSVLANPMAQQLQSYGRNGDTMLVHMTPDEVNSLQGLAMAAGGSLTINPDTGLPEASFLKKLLPMLAGIGLNFILPGSGIVASLGGKAATAGLMVGAGTTAITGDLQKGLMAGLGAFGGASLAGGVQGALAKTAVPTPGGVVPPGATPPIAPPTPVPGAPVPPPIDAALAGSPDFIAQQAAQAATQTATNAPGVLSRFGQGFAQTAKGNMTGMLGKAAVPMAGLGLLSTLSDVTTPTGIRTSSGQVDNSYQGPYTAQQRTAEFAPATADILGSSKERDYFPVDVPEIRNMQGQVVQPGTTTARGTPIVQSYLLPPSKKKNAPMYGFRTVPFMGRTEEEEQAMGMPYMGLNPAMQPGYADGGEVKLADGAFVVDARTVSELGNGSSNAGHELLARMGGRPVRGSGDGVSDSVPARIGRDQPARVARDEVVFSPEAVRRVGGGNEKRGAQKLYALMEKAHKARRKSARGKDTNLRRGLA